MTTISPAPSPQPVVERRKPTPKPRSFLFINKDAESEILSRSSGRVATSINSHVQRWQEKKGGRSKPRAKAEPLEQTSLSSKAPAYRDCVTKFRPKSRKKPEKKALKQEPPAFKRESSESSSSGPATAYGTTPESLGTSPESDCALEIVNRAVSQPLDSVIYSANFCGSDCIDPFETTYAHYPGVQPILQYYISFTKVSTFESEAKSKAVKPEPLHFPAIRRIVQGSLSQKMHMYALLAATAARMKSVSGITFARNSTPEYLLDKAIHFTRAHFDKFTAPLSADDGQVILDVFYLCVCQWYEKDYDGARTHLAFVREIWSSLKPSEFLFDKYIHDMITYNDVFLSIQTGQPPLFELTWDPESLPVGRVHEIEDGVAQPSASPGQSPSPAATSIRSPRMVSTSSSSYTKSSTMSSIAYGFMMLTIHNTSRLPIQLIAILADLVPLVRIMHRLHRQTHTPPSPTSTQWASLKTQALLHKLLSLPSTQTPPASSITLALIILLSCTSTSPAWRAGKLDMPHLSSRLRATLSSPCVIDNIHYEASTLPTLSPAIASIDDSLLLWILIAGAFAAQTHVESQQWFLEQAVQCAKRMGVYDVGVLRAELMRYLYLEHLQGVTLQRLGTAMRLS
jgi:hypothetical protein